MRKRRCYVCTFTVLFVLLSGETSRTKFPSNLVIPAASSLPYKTHTCPKKVPSFTPLISSASIALFSFPFPLRLLSSARSYASVSFKRSSSSSQRAIRRGRGCRGDRSRLWTREHQIKVSSPALPSPSPLAPPAPRRQ